MRERSIIHLNVADFAVAVERVVDSRLQKCPVIIAPEGAVRATVYDMSDEAYQSGVRKGMALRRALRYCHDAAVLPPHTDRYERAMAKLLKCALPFSPRIEMTDHKGHLFIDATGTGKLFGSPPDLAVRIRKCIRTDLGFDPIWSVASNKLVAKIANNIGKASVKSDKPPNTIKVVEPSQEAAFLAPLPVRELWGVGPKTAEQLAQLGIHTIGDLTRWPETDLGQRFGKLGHDLACRARGIDDRPVETEHEAKSISQETTFAKDIDDGEALRQVLRQLSEKVGRRLRRKELSGATVKIKLRWADFTTLTRQVTLDQPTNLDSEIYTAAEQLFEKT